jgi:predicted GNAT superfamily acetyltransferase
VALGDETDSEVQDQAQMKSTLSSTAISLRDIDGHDELQKIRAVEKIVWGLADHDVMPLTLMIAMQAAGSLWIGAYRGKDLVGFAFGFPGFEGGKLMVHSHMLAVLSSYRDSNLGYRLKLAQRDRVLRDGIQTMTWTFDPLQSKNAHFNFAKLGVVSDQYKVNFYGPETSSVLHRNGTDRLWVTWQLNSKRVQQRLQGKDERVLLLDTLANVPPLVRFGGTGRPLASELSNSLARQRICIEIPSDINSVERDDPSLAKEWRETTRWAFTESLRAGFCVTEFCRSIRGQQGPGAYILQKSTLEEFLPSF